MKDNYYAVIMAGGGGTRLWPLSRSERPKQMIELLGDRTMFQISVDRLEGLFPPERILVVTVEDQARQLQKQVPDIPVENFLLEPSPKNTASVVGLAAVSLQKRDPQAVMAILTADHHIQNVDRFHQLLAAAYQVAGEGFLATLGIEPTFASTGYGYIQTGSEIGVYEDLNVYHALRFLEKPDEKSAREFFESGFYTWNSGMFIWKVDQIVVEFARQMPELYAGLQLISRNWNTRERAATIQEVWSGLERISIDYGIMEGAENVAVIPASELGWNDVGSWKSLLDVLPGDQDGNVIVRANHLGFETGKTLIYGNNDQRLIVTLGIEDLIIVDTGDVLLICDKNNAQQVREVVQYLREKNSERV